MQALTCKWLVTLLNLAQMRKENLKEVAALNLLIMHCGKTILMFQCIWSTACSSTSHAAFVSLQALGCAKQQLFPTEISSLKPCDQCKSYSDNNVLALMRHHQKQAPDILITDPEATPPRTDCYLTYQRGLSSFWHRNCTTLRSLNLSGSFWLEN